MILETMYRALGFRRVVFCLRDPKTETLTGRFGLGERRRRVAPRLQGAAAAGGRAGADLFAAVCIKGADTLITDAVGAGIAARLPAWYRAAVNAPAFLLLPLTMKGAPFALIYADKARPGAHRTGREGTGAAAHAAQPGGDGVPAGHLSRQPEHRTTTRL